MSAHVLLQELHRGTLAFVPVGGSVVLGRDGGTCDVPCRDPHVSRRHCVVYGLPGGRLRVVDTSTYGTVVADRPVSGEAVAEVGDTIVLGYQFRLQVVGTIDSGETLARGVEPDLPTWLDADYLLLREVGRGGMGVVYEAYDRRRHERCALKVLRVAPGAEDRDELVARFEREARAQAALRDYPGIVTVVDQGRVPTTGELYCAMEFVEGTSLQVRVQEGLERAEGVRLVARVARAVAYAHERGIVHRDLKPANVMVSERGAVRLTDFGIARILTEDGRLTATGVMLGTPGYMAPEQIVDSKGVGPTADVYGLAAILYNVLTGKVPAKGKNLREALRSIEESTWDPPRALDPTIDPDLDAICLAALTRDPARRTPSAAALADALDGWLRRAAPAASVQLRPPG